MLTRSLAVVIGLIVAVGPQAGAVDLVTWGAAQNISGDSDVNTNGNLVYAYNLGASGVTDTTVNGVQFSAWAFPPSSPPISVTTIGSVSFIESFGILESYNTLGTTTGNFSGLSSAYQAMLSTAGTSSNAATVSLTMGGLTTGKSYEIQWWLNNSALLINVDTVAAFQQTTATATNSVLLNANVGTVVGNLGQYVIGSFTATDSSAVIEYNGTGTYIFDNRPMINAFQLRDVTAVPEPSTYVLAVIAGGTLVFHARRRSKRAVLA